MLQPIPVCLSSIYSEQYLLMHYMLSVAFLPPALIVSSGISSVLIEYSFII